MSGEALTGEEVVGALVAGLALRPAFEALWSGFVRALRAHRTPLVSCPEDAAARREAAEGARVVLLAWCEAHGYGAPAWCSRPVR